MRLFIQSRVWTEPHFKDCNWHVKLYARFNY